MQKKILVTICARGGSKGVPGKNLRSLLGLPLIAHTIRTAKDWRYSDKNIIVSTDSAEIGAAAQKFGVEAPFLRPPELSTDSAGKLPVLCHALEFSEKHFSERFDIVLDLDVTSPIRDFSDLDSGLSKFLSSKCDVCFSVVEARKNPYFNQVESDNQGYFHLSKPMNSGQSLVTRQSAPKVWDMNASIYFYNAAFLRRKPGYIWDGRCVGFEMDADKAFDIDEERDFIIVESLMKNRLA